MTIAILMGRTIAAMACIILPFESSIASWLLISLAGVQCYFNHRFRLIYQNGDTMFLIGFSAMAVAALDPRDSMLHAAAFAFLAFNVLLAYFMSGLDKLKSTHWRSGSLLVEIFWNHPHRFEPIGRLLTRHRSLAFVGSWSVILLELLFPLCVLMPEPFFYGYLAAGLFFHIAVSFTMGLHGFLWSFASTYPALYYVHAAWWFS